MTPASGLASKCVRAGCFFILGGQWMTLVGTMLKDRQQRCSLMGD